MSYLESDRSDRWIRVLNLDVKIVSRMCRRLSISPPIKLVKNLPFMSWFFFFWTSNLTYQEGRYQHSSPVKLHDRGINQNRVHLKLIQQLSIFVNQPGYYSFTVSAKSSTAVITYFNFAVTAKAAKGDELPFKTRCWVSTGEPVTQWHCAVLIAIQFYYRFTPMFKY